MLRAGALIIVLVVSIIMGLLSISLIMVAYYGRLQVRETHLRKRLERNANSGVNLLLSATDFVEKGQWETIDLYGEGTDSIELFKQQWGIYEIGIVRSFHGRSHRWKVCFMGKQAKDKQKISLYLTDQNRPLSVAGKTKIIGPAYLPAASVRKAYIEGRGFEGEEIVQGNIFTSEKQLPDLDPAIMEYLKPYFSLPADTVLPGFEMANTFPTDSMARSFKDDGMLVVLSGNIDLASISLKGKIIIVSPVPLTIPSSAYLEDIIVFAPSVTIKDDFKGNIQVFANDSIRVEENCHLQYPSVLGLIKRKDSLSVESTQPELHIGDGSTVSGVVFTKALGDDDFQKTRVNIHKNATVNGQVYSDGYIDLQGAVYGSVYCNRFILRTPSTLYENHLLDAIIDYKSLSKYYIGPSLLNRGKEGGIIKWLE